MAFESGPRVSRRYGRRWRTALWCGSAIVSVAFALPASAADLPLPGLTWTGTTSTDWFDPRNWLNGVVPASGLNGAVNTANPNPAVIGAGTHAGASRLGIGPSGVVTVLGALSTFSINNNGSLIVANGGTVQTVDLYGYLSVGSTGTLNIGAPAGQAAAAPGTVIAPSIEFGRGAGSVVFNHTSSNYVFSVPINGAGSVDVENGTTIFTASNGYTGATTINGGTLVVNGDISSSSLVEVNPGGTLSGTGKVPFTLLADGATLAPGPLGTGTGTLTITDRVMFCACSIYAVKVSATGNDLAQVVAGGFSSGDAFLDGLVRVSSPTSSYRFNSPYTILTTQGGLNDTSFSSLAAPTGIGGVLSYTATDVQLTLTSQLGQVAGLNAGQRAVGTALDAAFNGSGSSGALGGVFAGNIGQNLSQAAGEAATGAQQTTFGAMTQFLGSLFDHGAGGGGAAPASGATPFVNENAGASAYAMATKARPRDPLFDPRWSVWAAGFGGSQTTDGNAAIGANSATSRIGGVAVGADYLLSPRTIAGFALAGGGTNFSVANSGTGRSDLFQAGGFVKHSVGPAYISGALAYGWQDVTTDRIVTIAGVDRLQARFNANAYSGRVEGGYRFLMPWFGGVGLTPYAAGQFTTVELPAYAESAISGSNAFALNYGSKAVTDSRSELGLRADKSFALTNAILTLRGRAAWAHDFNPDRSIAATFSALPGASFVVNGAAQARDSALTTVAAEVKWLNGVSVAATFDGEFSDVTRSYAGKGVVRYAW
jgi:autotransporter-associated beta strand protein